jgi:hypothetical protein
MAYRTKKKYSRKKKRFRRSKKGKGIFQRFIPAARRYLTRGGKWVQ